MVRHWRWPEDFTWTSKCAFHFEANSPLEEVIESLDQLDEKPGIFTRNRMAIFLSRDGYMFRYRMRRSNRGLLYTTAVSDGLIWQAGDGPVVVEGQVQIEPRAFHGTLIICLLMSILFMVIGKIALPLLLLPIAAVYMLSLYYSDRNLMLCRIREAVAQTRPTIAEESDRTVSPNSLWSEALSEYDSSSQE
jgi:hypothetical protein